MLGERRIDCETLYSWKEVAVFLKCGVRTAQRWERNEGLPTHRHAHSRRGTVFAFKDELQAWIRRREPMQKTRFASGNDIPICIPPLQPGLLDCLCMAARERAARVRGVFEPYRRLERKTLERELFPLSDSQYLEAGAQAAFVQRSPRA